ncbi:hypothetical protein Gdia_1180 [Gluconacetobacter diazotrophicus PA1 5]|uniref:hypothetical protein n=1 Tax=Gluconacetobacter diazotrophicus TaxID=33996 RepID=UPI000173CEE1|nr:hypothetical protein [Gluconacetobacter diazotrophicus]ACI50963.1 hypothetical protein Gdia_1180 [Gluconacetobacter diazotrophicus PA1 5]TWB08582.1 hypothetical protein FBZ86_10679 [Gluconacetobacter diazotrophicus]
MSRTAMAGAAPRTDKPQDEKKKPGRAETEAKLDEGLDESFPASDPPLHRRIDVGRRRVNGRERSAGRQADLSQSPAWEPVTGRAHDTPPDRRPPPA